MKLVIFLKFQRPVLARDTRGCLAAIAQIVHPKSSVALTSNLFEFARYDLGRRRVKVAKYGSLK